MFIAEIEMSITRIESIYEKIEVKNSELTEWVSDPNKRENVGFGSIGWYSRTANELYSHIEEIGIHERNLERTWGRLRLPHKYCGIGLFTRIRKFIQKL